MSFKQFVFIVLAFLCGAILFSLAHPPITSIAFGAPTANVLRNILPEIADRYDVGTSTNEFNRGYFNYASTTATSATTLCLTGDTCRTTWPTGGGSGNVGTSSVPVIGNLAYWTTTTATPALLSTVATSSVTISSPLTSGGTAGYVVGGSSWAIGLDTSGTWTGNAGTATALAANGADCSAGSFPLGVNTLGAVESCTDAWTEAENTAAGYTSNTGTVTSIATTWPITGKSRRG